jgi:hypothetical protein
MIINEVIGDGLSVIERRGVTSDVVYGKRQLQASGRWVFFWMTTGH